MSTEKHQITVNGLVVDVVRKNIKNLHLGVYPPSGRVRVAAPLRVNDEAVRLFTISKLAWIKRQQAKFEGQERCRPVSLFPVRAITIKVTVTCSM